MQILLEITTSQIKYLLYAEFFQTKLFPLKVVRALDSNHCSPFYLNVAYGPSLQVKSSSFSTQSRQRKQVATNSELTRADEFCCGETDFLLKK